MMLVCGPVPVEQWARNGVETLGRFAQDASYREGDAIHAE
jgi:hypothetical protein